MIESEEDTGGYCTTCAGSGEGQYDDTTCSECKGSGEINLMQGDDMEYYYGD